VSAGSAPLRVVIVNHMHPSVPHVSAMRAWYFACDLAARGHQVVLICEWTTGAPPAPDSERLCGLLRGTNWSHPLVVAVQPRPGALHNRLRSARTPAIVRKALVAWSYLTQSGVFTDFSQAAQPALEQIARVFKPQVVWGVFGNTDCWLIAQRQAHLAGCGWVGDMKDAWDGFVPAGLRTMIARRFTGMTASTANAGFHANVLAHWFPTHPDVVYSGVSRDWIRPVLDSGEDFRVMLVGSTYDLRNLNRLMDALKNWVYGLSPLQRDQVTFGYAGSDSAVVRAAARELAGLVRMDVRSHVPIADLADLCRAAAVNVYLWSPATFHHKVVELLCCQRPVVSFPGERAETLELACKVGGSLNVCRNERDLQEVFRRAWARELKPLGGPEALQSLTWDAQGERLEAVLRRVAEEGATCAH